MAKLFSPLHLHPALAPLCILLTTLVLALQTAGAAELVTGRYLSAGGTSVVLSLSLQKPSPANLIVELDLAPGNSIVATSPPAKKVDGAKGKVKWLFKNTNNGTLTLSIQLKAPLQGRTSATVRYRQPGSGSFTELRIVP